MKLVAYVLEGQPFAIRHALLERDWMNKTDEHFAYRCPPLNTRRSNCRRINDRLDRFHLHDWTTR
jgi:hypothetical protein